MSRDTFAHDHEWMTFSLLRSFVGLFGRLFIYLFNIVLLLRSNDSFGRLPRCHIYSHIECPTYNHMYFIILRDFVYFCTIYTFSHSFFCCLKAEYQPPPHILTNSNLTRVTHLYLPSSLLSFFLPGNELKYNRILSMQSNINAKRCISLGFCQSYHLFTLK